MKFDHNQILTRDKEIEVGKQYIYRESMPSILAEVKILADDSDEEFIRFTVEVIKSREDFTKIDGQFTISARRGHYAYGGMWRLEDSGTYLI